MNPALPTRKGKRTVTKAIDGSPMEYEVIDEAVFPAISNANKAFALHKIKLSDGRQEYRIGYYMIAHRPRMKGKWAWGQFAPIMTKAELAMICDKIRELGWV